MAAFGWEIDDVARLDVLRESGVVDMPPNPRFDAIAASAALQCSTPIGMINVIGHGKQYYKARYGFDLPEPPIEDAICVHTLHCGTKMVIEDLKEDDRTKNLPSVSTYQGLRFYAATPIVFDNQCIGTLAVLDFVPRRGGLTSEQLTRLDRLSSELVNLIWRR